MEEEIIYGGLNVEERSDLAIRGDEVDPRGISLELAKGGEGPLAPQSFQRHV